MRRHRLQTLLSRSAAVAMLIALAGCGDIFSPHRAQSQFEENRDKWRALGMTSYSFTLNQSCFCGITGPVRVGVFNGAVVSALVVSSGQSVDTRFVSTIESLFDFIERGIAKHSAVLEVTYDPARGFPTKIVSDGSRNIADDEVTYEVSDVQPLATTTASGR